MGLKPVPRQAPARRSKQSWNGANRAYLALARRFPIRPIHSHAELDDAIRMLNTLLRRDRPLGDPEQGYFDSLANEIQRYEAAAVPMPAVSGPEMIRFLMDQKGVSLSDVARHTGIVISTLSATLSHKRKLNVSHMRALARYFGVEVGALI